MIRCWKQASISGFRLIVAALLIGINVSGADPAASESGTAVVLMRDGHEYTVRFEVPGPGRWPVVFAFGNSRWLDVDAYLAAGYAVVLTDPRDLQFHHDAADSYDLIQWISDQPWSDGQVAMAGISRGAATQWAAATSKHPSLKAIFPVGISPEPWRRMYRDHGAIQLAHTMNGRAVFGNSQPHQWWHLPLIDMDLEFRGTENEAWRNYVGNSEFNEYWQAIDLRGRYDAVDVAVYQSTGWYDNYPIGALTAWRALHEEGRISHNRIRVHGRAHGGDGMETTESIRFFDLILKGRDDGIGAEQEIQLYVQQTDEWRGYASWPPQEAASLELYLRAHGDLSDSPAVDAATSTFAYDPADPTPTIFTNTSKSDPHPEWINAGQGDITRVWNRVDVATFQTGILEEAAEVIGPVRVELNAETDRPDTDWVARLVDIDADGIVRNVADGIIRARFHNDIWGTPSPLTPGAVTRYEIALEGTAYRFERGHRIGLIVASASFPMWDRNLNTGEPIGMTADMVVANQKIHHGGTFRSRLVLPVVNCDLCE